MKHFLRPLCGAALAILSIVGFASTFVAGRELAGVMGVSPSILVFSRFTVAGLAMALCALMSPTLRKSLFSLGRRDWLRLLWLGPIGTAFMAWCVFKGCSLVPVANASMADALTPLGIFAVSSLATRRATPLQVVGVLVGFVGALYTIGVVDGRGIHLSAYGIGDFVIMLSALAWGVYTALGRDDVKRIGPYAFSVWTMLIGAVSMAVLIAAGSALHHLSGEGVHIIAAFVWPCGAKAWALVAFIGFFCTLMPFSAWNAAQKYMPLSVLGMTAYFTPVVAITIDRVIRGRTVTRWQLFGTLLICLSAIVEVGRHRD